MKLDPLILAGSLCSAAGALVVTGCCQPDTAELDAEHDAFDFDRYEFVTDAAPRQTVVTGFLLGGAMAEIAVVKLNESGDRHLRIYSFVDGNWAPSLDATLRPGVLFVDVAEIDGRDQLLTYEPGRLNGFDPESGAERALVAVDCSFVPPRTDEVPHVDVTRDVNGDGRDDLVVPHRDGFRVFVQEGGGAFAEPLAVGRPPDLSGIYGADGYRYEPWTQSRVHEVDYDQDGRGDLVFWNGDHFEVHAQDERGLFTPEAGTFPAGVAFDSDDPFWLATGEMRGRVLHSLADLNADGVADLIVFSLEGRRIARKRSAYEVHFGAPVPGGGTRFAPVADVAFRSDDSVHLGLERHDLDHDGQVDLMLTTIELDDLQGSLWKDIKGAMGDDIRLELEFYRQEGGQFAATPDASRLLALDGVPSHREPGSVSLDIALRGATHERRRTQKAWPRAFNSTLRLGDVTGDGLSDLILGQHPRSLSVFAGVPGPELFARRSQDCLLYTSPSPRDRQKSRMPSSA